MILPNTGFIDQPQQMEQTAQPQPEPWGPWLRDALHPAIAPGLLIVLGGLVYWFRFRTKINYRRKMMRRPK